MKEMVYTFNRTFSILSQGIYYGVPYWIISLGTHPCTYLEITNFPELENVWCHGGITYDEDWLANVWDESFEDFKPETRRFIGWDYGHVNDFDGFWIPQNPTVLFDKQYYMSSVVRNNGLKKWTTKELVKEVKDVIDGTYDDPDNF